MQDAVLRVLVVALGLLLGPRNDPGLQQEDRKDLRIHKERLLWEEKELDQQIVPGSEEMRPVDDGPQYTMSDSEDVTASKAESKESEGQFISASDPTHTLESKSEHVISQKPSQGDREPQGELQTDTGADNKTLTEQIPPPEQQDEMSRNDMSQQEILDSKEDYFWYVWNTFSVISLMRFLGKCLRKTLAQQREVRIAGEAQLPNSDTLKVFYHKYVQASSKNKWKEVEFLEGFVNHIVEAMRVVCDDGGIMIEDCQMLNPCDIIVPFTPSGPSSFQCRLRNQLLPDTQLCGQIKVVENTKSQDDCPCRASRTDMVCLLHCENEKVKNKGADICQSLCSKDGPFLSQSQVSRWFLSTVKQAWARISHRYEFELGIRYIDTPGALVIHFRSGKKLHFSVTPVVKFNTDAHFAISPHSNLDTFWSLSLTSYEDQLLQRLSQKLPENSCHLQTLEIAQFLLRRQKALSGSCALKECHLKMALIHLLLTRKPAEWKHDRTSHRLRDLLGFLKKSLERKQLFHVIIGNPQILNLMPLPLEFSQAKPVNLFHPFAAQSFLYRNAAVHFQEMLRNTEMLIHDFVDGA